MSEDITGRDDWIITLALATALIALEQLPEGKRPRRDMDDIKKLLAAGGPSSVSRHLARAKCTLFPDLDLKDVAREYGLTSLDGDSESET